MADDVADKTEDATAKKLTDSRKKGQVAKSQDLTTAFILLTGMIMLLTVSKGLYEMLAGLTVAIFTNLDKQYVSHAGLVFWFDVGIKYTLLMIMPVLGAIFVMALLVNIYQVGLVISPESLKPKWDKLNIFNMKNFKKFFEISAVMKMVFGLSKLAVVGFVVGSFIMGLLPEIETMVNAKPKELLLFLAESVLHIGLVIALILIILGIADTIYQRWKFARDMKMSKQEVKEERKQQEGDMHVKSRMREMMQKFSQSRMKGNVPHADVVIANPIHYAVAIKYDPDNMVAPVCLAKGARLMALAIKDIARENNVPIVENPLLARAMYKVVEVGQMVPPDFYHAVAEVLAYIYRLDEKMKARDEDVSLPLPGYGIEEQKGANATAAP
ncbi:MAG: flagellar biosynthetic protein FlhB [Chlamydiales bacterium]|jgi:flagellar biosynthetic protein FlhB